MKKSIVLPFFFCSMLLSVQQAFTQTQSASGIQLDSVADTVLVPEGFSASVVATHLDGARHLAATKQGNLYVKLGRLKEGKGIVYLADTDGNGTFDQQTLFGDYPGTGICIRDGYLYASSNDDVFRYKLDDKGEVTDKDNPEKIVTGLVNHNRDNSKSLTADGKGNIYVNVGSYLNACLTDTNTMRAPNPCPLLDSAGGIWQFKTDKLNQKEADGIRYGKGFKNVVGLDWNNATQSLYVMQHGRDGLHDLYPQLYTAEQSGLLPAETLYEVTKGGDGGWPYVYYDQYQHKKIVAPEYGGDGKQEGGKNTLDPVAVFPAHLAPNGLLFYSGSSFPAKYKNGAFIAFHGKSPELQKGYLIGFVPFKKGKPAGNWQIFAEGFTSSSGQHKPCGLAEGPDGSLYVADDAKGTIYKIAYQP